MLPAATSRAETVCYDAAELETLAKAIRGLDECETTLELRERFIEEQKLAPVPQAAWWQEPSVIVSGTVVSFALGSLVTAYIIHANR